MHDPELLLLDEPTAGVDPKARREFWDQIHRLAQKGLTVLVSTHYMDEAERCHRIAYILYGKMVDVGSIDDVVFRSGLTTWEIKGEDLGALAMQLNTMSGVDQVSYFGSSLHVAGRKHDELNASMKLLQQNKELDVKHSRTSLEDVFIHYMENKHIE
jgi:ABC-2 type transport system ATP-binding protein